MQAIDDHRSFLPARVVGNGCLKDQRPALVPKFVVRLSTLRRFYRRSSRTPSKRDGVGARVAKGKGNFERAQLPRRVLFCDGLGAKIVPGFCRFLNPGYMGMGLAVDLPV